MMTDYYAAYAFYRASGLPDAEAHAKAEEACLPNNVSPEERESEALRSEARSL